MRSESSRLLQAIDAIDRRLAFRRAALGAAVGSIAAAPVAIVWPGAWWAKVLGGAAVGAFVAHRRRRRSLDWLEIRDRGNDLIVSAAAVAGGSTRRTALADRVVTSGARAIDSLKPSLLPAVIAALAVVAVLALSWVTGATSRSVPAPRAGRADATDQPTTEPGARVARGDGPTVLDTRDGEPREHESEPSHGGAASQPAEAIGGVGSGASTTGRGELHGLYESPASIVAERAAHTVHTSAPIAGASAALIAVPLRYRGLARAFLEAR